MIWDDAPCGLLALRPDGGIDQVNPTFLQWTGYAREELVGRRPFRDLLAGGGRIFYETHLAPLLQLQGAVREIAVEILCADGRRLPALLNASLQADETGSPRRITIALFDATQRRGYENELLRERQRAEQADRVKADFISMVSHEIRSPLNGIFGIAQLLDLSAPLTPGQRELIQLLRRSCDNLLDLVNEILDFSKVESGVATLEERSFDLRHLISGVTQPLQVKAEGKGLSLEIQVDDRVPARLLGDPIKIAQVLTNLLSNAIKFTERGTVTLTLEAVDTPAEVTALAFCIRDTGIGIPAEQLPHIFDGFAQASYDIGLKYGGTGLGLAISKKLVELHGSRLAVESEPGHGTAFTFQLRLKTAPPGPRS